MALIRKTLAQGPVGAYQLQTAIAACHDEAAHVDATDWLAASRTTSTPERNYLLLKAARLKEHSQN